MTPVYADPVWNILLATSLLSIVGVCVMAYGYRSSLVSEDAVTRWFATSMILLALGYALRRFTWDLMMPLFLGEIYYNPINILYNLINIVAAYYGLKARLMLIPDGERDEWRWYTAWMHPGLLRSRSDDNEENVG